MDPWSKPKVIEEIQKIHNHGQFPSYAFVSRNEPELLNAALLLFGTWERALVKARAIRPPIDSDEFFDHDLCVWAHDSLTIPINR